MIKNSMYDEDIQPGKQSNTPDKSDVTDKSIYKEIDYGFSVKDSIIYVHGDIVLGLLFDFVSKVRTILDNRTVDKDTPITVLINSDGGDVYEALGIIDYFDSLPVPVNVVARGRAMSAAALILCAGTGVRVASKYSTIMFHEISSDIYGKSSDMKANVQHMEKLENILLEIISTNSKESVDFWKGSTIKDFYITPEEALELGVIDTIIQPKHKRG